MVAQQRVLDSFAGYACCWAVHVQSPRKHLPAAGLCATPVSGQGYRAPSSAAADRKEAACAGRDFTRPRWGSHGGPAGSDRSAVLSPACLVMWLDA